MTTVSKAGTVSVSKENRGITELAIYTNDGQLVALYWERDDGTLAHSKAGDSDFDGLCRAAGVKQTVYSVRIT